MTARDNVAPDWPDARGLEAVLGYEFKSISLLETALQHSSYANEVAGDSVRRSDGEGSCRAAAGVSNERLEFLGDSVLGIVVAHGLYEAHPHWAEGELTVALQNLVDQRSLAKLGLELEIGSYLRLGRTERQSAGHAKPAILSDAVEAILGAMYLDGGLAPVEQLLQRVFATAFRPGAVPAQRDPKTRFQEWVMAESGAFPVYECIRDSEINGDEERFTVRAMKGGESWGEGTARSKRKAEKMAAMQALERIEREAER